MAIPKEHSRNITELLPKVESDDELVKENKQLLAIGSRAAHCTLGLSGYQLGLPLEEVRESINEGCTFLENDLEEDLKMIEQGSDYSKEMIFKRIEKHYDPEKIIREVFPKQVKASEKITSKEIKKIRLEIRGWEKILKNLSEGKLSIYDERIGKLKVRLVQMSEPYLKRANECWDKYVRKSHPGINID